MKKSVVFVFLAFLTAFAPSVWADEVDPPELMWEVFYNVDSLYTGYFQDLLLTENGVLAVGVGLTPDPRRYWVLVEFSSEGEVINERHFRSRYPNPYMSVIHANDGGYVLIWGHRVIKIDNNLETIWQIELGGWEYYKMKDIIAIEDGYLLVGYVLDVDLGCSKAGFIRLAENGEIISRKLYGVWDDRAEASQIIQRANGQVFISGWSHIGLNDRGWILEVTEDGDSLNVLCDFRGYYKHVVFMNPLDERLRFTQTSTVYDVPYEGGDLEFVNHLNIRGHEELGITNWVYDFCWLGNTGAITTGNFCWDYGNNIDEDYHLFLSRHDENYDMIWHLAIPACWEQPSGGYGIVPAPDGGYYFCGEIHYGGTGFYLARTEPDPCSVDPTSSPEPCETFCLNPAYPNPFNSTTTIHYTAPQTVNCELTMLDISGRVIDRVDVAPGNGTYTWTAPQSGVYIVRLASGDRQTARKLVCVE